MTHHPILCLCGHFHGGACPCGCAYYEPDTCNEAEAALDG